MSKTNDFNKVENPVDCKKRKRFKTWQKIVVVLLLFAVLICLRAFSPLGLGRINNTNSTSADNTTDTSSMQTDITCAADLEGKKVGSLVGSACLDDAVRLAGSSGQALGFNTTADLCQALQGNKIDAIAIDGPVCEYASNQMGNTSVLPDSVSEIQYGAIFSKTSTQSQQIRTEFNEFLKKYNEEGKTKALWDKWCGSDDSAKTIDYSNITGERGTLEIATTSNTGAPSAYIKNNMLVGADIEIAVDFCAYAGYMPVFKDMAFDSIIMSISTNKYPLSVASFTITEERAQSVDFSNPYYDGSCKIAVKTGQSSASGGIFESIYQGIKKTFIDENRWELFVSGCYTSFLISMLAIIFGTLLGFIVFFIGHKGGKIFNKITDGCIWLLKGMPVVVLLMILFYIVFGKAAVSGVFVSVVAFTLLFAAVTIGLLRTGLDAIDDGQREAGLALGYTDGKTFIKIILPQAIRHILPNFESEAVELLKGTSIVGYIAVQDLTKIGDMIRSATYDAIFPLLSVALLYFVLEAIIKLIIRVCDKVLYQRCRTDKHILKDIKAIDIESEQGKREIDEILQDVQKQVYDYVAKDDNQNAQESKANSKIIRFEHMKKTYDGKNYILKDVNTTINKGDVITLIGGSGCGKTTLIRCLNYLDPPTEGSIYIDGRDITKPDVDVTSIRKKVGTIFQRWNLFDHWTVIENVMRPLIDIQNISKQDAYDMSFRTLAMLGLGAKAMAYPRELSGGQQQRVAICRTLVMQNDIVVLDEPTSALDPCTVSEVATCLRYVALHDKTLIIVTHDMHFAQSISNKIFFICDGKIYEEGSPSQILDNPQKPKTRAFIEQVINQDLTISKTDPDMLNGVSQISEFCMRYRISQETEELIIRSFISAMSYVFLPLMNRGIQVAAKVIYSQKYNKIYLGVKYSGDKFDALEDIENNLVDKKNYEYLKSKLGTYEYAQLDDDELHNFILVEF